MSPDETPAGAPEDWPSQSDDGGVDVDVMYATSTAFGSAHVGELEAAQTAVGSASVDGDATFSASAVGMLTCRDVSMRQTYAGAIMAEGNATMKQSGASAILGERIEVNNGGAAMLWAQEVSISHGWVGVVAGKDVTISDDSRVLIDVKAALIIAAALLGGFGIIALVALVSGRRVASRLPRLSELKMPDLRGLKLPELGGLKMPDLSQLSHVSAQDLHRIVSRLAKMRHAS